MNIKEMRGRKQKGKANLNPKKQTLYVIDYQSVDVAKLVYHFQAFFSSLRSCQEHTSCPRVTTLFQVLYL